MLERDADLTLAEEHLDALRVLAPALAQGLDGHPLAVGGAHGAVDAAETTGGHLIEHPVAADEVAGPLSLEQPLALPGSEVAFPLQGAEQGRGKAAPAGRVARFFQLG